MMLSMLAIELKKLYRSLALLLCILAPMLVAVVSSLIAFRQGQSGWQSLSLNAFALWCFLVLPMLVAVLSALLAQIEHGPRMWDHLYTLPVSRQQFLMAKWVVLMILVLASSLALSLFTALFGSLVPGSQPSSIPWRGLALLAAMTSGASGLMASIQLAIAVGIRSFIAPIGLGLAGTFVLIASMGASETAWLPWSLPMATLSKLGTDPLVSLLVGSLGGLALFPLAALALARRDQV